MKLRTILWAFAVAAIVAPAYLFWVTQKPNLLGVGDHAASALIEGDISELYAHMSSEEKARLSPDTVKAGWDHVLQKMGGANLTLSRQHKSDGGEKEAEWHVDVKAPDGVEFILAVPVFAEGNRAVTCASITLSNVMIMYWRSRFKDKYPDGPPVRNFNEVFAYFREDLKAAGWTEFYDYRDGIWYSVDELCTIVRRPF